jgi:protein Tob/BTG
MKQELKSAANLIVHLLRLNKNCRISEAQLKKFRDCLIENIYRRCRDHWFPDAPEKGSGYRSLRFYEIKKDSCLSQACEAAKLKKEFVQEMLPNDLMIWINPLEVLYRIGEDSCICILYDHTSTEPWNHKALINKSDKKKSVKKNQINPFAVMKESKQSKKKDPLEEIEYRLKTKRSISLELLAAYAKS